MKFYLFVLLVLLATPYPLHAGMVDDQSDSPVSKLEAAVDFELLLNEYSKKFTEIDKQLNEVNEGFVKLREKVDRQTESASKNNAEYTTLLSRNDQAIETLTDNLENIRNEIVQLQTRLKQSSQSFNEREQLTDNKIQKNIARLESLDQDIGSMGARLDETLKEQITRIDSTHGQLKEVQDSLSKYGEALEQITSKVAQNQQDLAQVNNAGLTLTQKTQRVNVYLGVAVIILFLMSIGLFLFIYRSILPLVTSTKESTKDMQQHIEGEGVRIDTQLTDLMQKQLEILANPIQEAPGAHEETPDHSLPLKVATEINRMRTRIANMPEDTKGVKALSKALERLEEELDSSGYEIVALVGKPYNEGMPVKPLFVTVDTLETGEEIITKVILPQVNFKDTLIQAAEVEVSIGE